jgi:hypothetical protein
MAVINESYVSVEKWKITYLVKPFIEEINASKYGIWESIIKRFISVVGGVGVVM